MTALESSDRFLRPDDLRLIRRNRRQVQAERILAVGGRLLFAFVIVMLGYWLYERTQQDSRFAVRAVELAGVKHTSPAALKELTDAYVGLNLFKLNIERVQNDLRALAWIESVSIEKKLPSTLRITVVEREPVALAIQNGIPKYVDRRGVAFAELSPSVGNPDLPLVTTAGDSELVECVRLLTAMRDEHPAVYSRISEISPAAENGFVVFDRDLRTRILIEGKSAAEKWEALYAIAGAEGRRNLPAEYVDLRFANRIIVKPIEGCGVPGAECRVVTNPALGTGHSAPSQGESR